MKHKRKLQIGVLRGPLKEQMQTGKTCEHCLPSSVDPDTPGNEKFRSVELTDVPRTVVSCGSRADGEEDIS